jgi:hypothetical protein
MVSKPRPQPPEIVMTFDCWQHLYAQMNQDYPSRVMMLPDILRKTVGFTKRVIKVKSWQQRWNSTLGACVGEIVDETRIRLVFTGSPKFTLFCLKYAKILGEHRCRITP